MEIIQLERTEFISVETGRELPEWDEKLYQATVAYYIGNPLQMSDKEYDERRKVFEHSTGISILNFMDFGPHREVESELLSLPYSKISVSDTMEQAVLNLNHDKGSQLVYPKLDGTSIVIEYHEGRLKEIYTKNGMKCKMHSLKPLVPPTVDPDIKAIFCEAVVEMESRDSNVRNAANGLVNSIHLTERVLSELILVPFQVSLSDDILTNVEGLELLSTYSYKGRTCFVPVSELDETEISNMVDSYSYSLKVEEDSIGILIDGLVCYDENSIVALKFYAQDKVEVEITEIQWIKNANHTYFPKAIIDGVHVDGKWIKRVSLGSVSNMVGKGLGVGSRFIIFLSNGVIPAVGEVLLESDNFQLPKCESCGTQMTLEDAYGSSLRCPNIDCPDRHKRVTNHFLEDEDNNCLTSIEQYKGVNQNYIEWSLGVLCFIDRFNPYKSLDKRFKLDYKASSEELDKIKSDFGLEGDFESPREILVEKFFQIIAKDYSDEVLEEFMDLILTVYKFSGLQWRILNLNYKAALVGSMKMHKYLSSKSELTIEEYFNK